MFKFAFEALSFWVFVSKWNDNEDDDDDFLMGFKIFPTVHRVPEKNGTNNILGITLAKFNKFSQLLAQIMLTCQLTKKI